MIFLVKIRYFFVVFSLTGILVFSGSCRQESFSPSQADSFIKFFGQYNDNRGIDVKSLEDGFVITGTISPEIDRKAIVLIRTDKFGNDIWPPKQFGGQRSNHAVSLAVLSDVGFAILGNAFRGEDDLSIRSNFYLIRTDSRGDTLWTRKYGGYSDDTAHHFALTSDGGFIMIGSTKDIVTGKTDILLVKTDREGEVLWTRTHGGENDDAGTFVAETSEGYIYTGYTRSYSQPGQSGSNIFIAKTNSQGRITFPVTYGFEGDDSGKAVVPLPGGGYIVLGTIINPESNLKNLFLARIEENISSPVWIKTFGELDDNVAGSVALTPEGDMIITGTREFSDGNHVIFLMKTDSAGNLLFSRTFGGSGKQRAEAVDLTHDNGYIVAGSNELGGNSMITLIKTKASGDL